MASTAHSRWIWRTILALVFLLSSALVLAQVQKFKVLHTFHGNDGASPEGVLVRDGAGNIYGTTVGGGTGKCSKFGCGTVFKLNKVGKQVWLHSFEGGNGYDPVAGLLRDAAAPVGVGVSLAAGDFNNDGRTDLVVGSADGVTNAVVFLQTVAGVSPTSIAFGNQPVGKKSPPRTVTFTNDKAFSLKINHIRIVGNNSNEFQQTNNCGPTLPAGGSCQIKVTFQPNTRGPAAADIVVRYDGTGGPQTAPLSGTGT
jgi:uncharacterized repeat protein (TIGR03803 family)